MKLSSYAHGRNNNFNLIRMVAALAVLVGHAFVLRAGADDADPLARPLGMTLGSIAVDVFFITSGFLVTASLLSRQSPSAFVRARVLRIYPALVVMTLITVFGLGLFFTSLSVAEYFSTQKTYTYLLKNSTLLAGVAMRLPGVFGGNPYVETVNGSLWTMPHEVRMYALLLALWLLARAAWKDRPAAFRNSVIGVALAALIWQIGSHYYLQTEVQFVRLGFMFFTGAVFHILRERIVLSRSLFWLLLASLLLSSLHQPLFFLAYTGTIAYLLLYLAYVPAGFVRAYNRLGDYSYGVYIYAFPVQQSLMALMPQIGVPAMVVISGAVTLLLAVLSWHLLERYALELKDSRKVAADTQGVRVT